MKAVNEGWCEAFALVAELAHVSGVAAINRLPGCWEVEVGGWWLAVNGHRTPTGCSRGVEVPPLSAYVERGVFMAGILDPLGGVMVGWDGATENGLIAALRSAITAAKKEG
jgi:hypothetical protein